MDKLSQLQADRHKENEYKRHNFEIRKLRSEYNREFQK